MEVQIKEVESIPMLSIDGEISLYDVDLISKSVTSIRESGNNSFLVNMKDVPFMDSSGIGVFMQVIIRLEKENGNMFFVNCSKRIKHLLSLSVGNTTAKIFDTIDEALDELKKIGAKR